MLDYQFRDLIWSTGLLIFSEFIFSVLADHAGEGKVEVTVKSDGDIIPSELEALGEGAFEVSFMGEGETIHTLDITFNGEHIPGNWNIPVLRKWEFFVQMELIDLIEYWLYRICYGFLWF